jgi:hypothetical protein
VEQGDAPPGDPLEAELDPVVATLFGVAEIAGRLAFVPAGDQIPVEGPEAAGDLQGELALGRLEGVEVPIPREGTGRVEEALHQPLNERIHHRGG